MVPRSGFETALEFSGFAKHVYVQAMSQDGRPLPYGRSPTIATNAVEVDLSSSDYVAELAWLEAQPGVSSFARIGQMIVGGITIWLALLGFHCIAQRCWRRDQSSPSSGGILEFDELLSPKHRRSSGGESLGLLIEAKEDDGLSEYSD